MNHVDAKVLSKHAAIKVPKSFCIHNERDFLLIANVMFVLRK